jgi:hypothetical protein
VFTAPGALESVSLGRSGKLASLAGGEHAFLTAGGEWRRIALASGESLHATLVSPREDRAYFAGEAGALLEVGADGVSPWRVRSEARAALRGIEDLEAR